MSGDIVVVQQSDPLTVLLNLPDGCTSGRCEAAIAFAQLVAEMHRLYPGEFTLLPFSFNTPSDGTNPALDSILAIAKK